MFFFFFFFTSEINGQPADERQLEEITDSYQYREQRERETYRNEQMGYILICLTDISTQYRNCENTNIAAVDTCIDISDIVNWRHHARRIKLSSADSVIQFIY